MKPGSVFLNYRHEDTSGYAGRLYDRLKSRFPGRVFRDFDEIPPGSDFAVAIENAVGQCAVLLALIGKHWLNDGRLQNPADFVRLEIAAALKRNIAVIPVLVGGASLPDTAQLTDDLSALTRRQAIVISDANWEGDSERLIRGLEEYLGRARTGAPAKRWAVAAAVSALAIGVTIAVYLQHRPPVLTVAADPEFQEAARKNVEAEVKGLGAITTAMNGVAQQIGNAGQPSPGANGLLNISTVVKDKSTGKPVAGAVVMKMPNVTTGLITTLGATDDSGRLTLRVLAGDKLNLLVTHPNYRDARSSVDPAKSTSLEIALELN